MNKKEDFFEKWVKSQNEFFNTWMESQEKFIKYWAETATSMQNTMRETAQLHNIPSADRYFPEYLNWLYSPSTMSDELINNQQLLRTTFQRQMEIFEEMVKYSALPVKPSGPVAPEPKPAAKPAAKKEAVAA